MLGPEFDTHYHVKEPDLMALGDRVGLDGQIQACEGETGQSLLAALGEHSGAGPGDSLLSLVAIFLAPKKTSHSFLIFFVFQS